MRSRFSRRREDDVRRSRARAPPVLSSAQSTSSCNDHAAIGALSWTAAGAPPSARPLPLSAAQSSSTLHSSTKAATAPPAKPAVARAAPSAVGGGCRLRVAARSPPKPACSALDRAGPRRSIGLKLATKTMRSPAVMGCAACVTVPPKTIAVPAGGAIRHLGEGEGEAEGEAEW